MPPTDNDKIYTILYYYYLVCDILYLDRNEYHFMFSERERERGKETETERKRDSETERQRDRVSQLATRSFT